VILEGEDYGLKVSINTPIGRAQAFTNNQENRSGGAALKPIVRPPQLCQSTLFLASDAARPLRCYFSLCSLRLQVDSSIPRVLEPTRCHKEFGPVAFFQTADLYHGPLVRCGVNKFIVAYIHPGVVDLLLVPP